MPRGRIQHIAIISLGALLYALLGWWSLRLAFTQANASAVWPLAGLGIGVLARFGFRYWPMIFIGAFATNLLVNIHGGVAMPVATLAALGIALGNTAESLIGAWMARRALGNPPELRSVEGVFRCVLLACSLPPLLSAGCGALSLRLAGILPASQFEETMFTWYTGNVGGILACAPLFFIDSLRPSQWKASRRAVAEWAVVMAMLVFVGQTIGGMHFEEVLPGWPKVYMIIPLVLWVACRLGRRGVVFAVLLLMGIGVLGTMQGFAAFPADSPEQSLLSLQLFLSVVAVIGLTVSVLVHQLRLQRRALENALVDRAARLAAATQENAILTTSAVHELQSPLSGIRNLLQLVRGTPEVFAEPEGGRLLGEMQTSVERMLEIINEALTMARPGDGTSLIRTYAPCDLTALLKRVIEAEQLHADSKRIVIRRSLPVQPVVVHAPGSVIEHIVGNFLSNAVKFSNPGTSVFIDLEPTASEVTISVSDEGPGIPERDRANVFSGAILSNSARPTGGEASSGVGLYLVGELALRIGARVACGESKSGGSVFSVSIPRAAP